MSSSTSSRWDIFCRVIDNFGDAGVCWRLARQLADEHGVAPRLFIDRPEVLDALAPPARRAGIETVHWRPDWGADEIPEPAAVVIDAFGTRAPEPYVRAMATRSPQPVWINLEYLSAESWVDGCHGLASPHPQLPLVRWFFFPGFSAASGGLLREAGLSDRMDALARTPHAAFASAAPGALRVSLFSYENAAIASLLDAWSQSARPVCCVVPEGRARSSVEAWLGGPLQTIGQRGGLQLVPLGFQPQAGYDALLAACDFNFVRGEDSFLRAQWAGKPFAWHIYAQEEDAHMAKLQAFLDRYCEGLAAPVATALRDFHLAWNHGGPVDAAWDALAAALPELRCHALAWRAQLTQQLDLSAQLARFAQSKLK